MPLYLYINDDYGEDDDDDDDDDVTETLGKFCQPQ